MRYKKRTDKFKSGFEALVAKQLKAAGAVVDYEPDKYSFPVPETGRKCGECGSKKVLRNSSYRPDFKLRPKAYVESKGKLTAANRKRLVAFKELYPDITVYLLFQRAKNWTSASKRETYGQWATKAGFKWADGAQVPSEWLRTDQTGS